jgi:diguanylate cyclase (GGDEF)-like protein/PAS domain S-box-containing protein
MTVPRPRILAIDDTPLNLLILEAVLSPDVELQIATSGAEGLALAADSPPDLILLDVMMPGMDGFETCRRLKANPALCDIPVVFVTALTELDAEARGLGCGAADYILKPINVRIAQQRIRNLLEREGLRREIASHRDQLAARIAELEQSARRLAQSEEQAQLLLRQNQLLLDHIFVGICIVRERRFVTVNGYAEALFGYAPGELNGQSTEVIYPDRAAYLALGQRAYPFIQRGETFTAEIELAHKDGQRFWCLMRAQALVPDAPLAEAIWILEDATERRAARRAQEEAAELYRAIFESRDLIKVLINPDDGRILDANQAAAAFYGFSREVLRQRRAWEQNASTSREALLALFADFKAGRRDVTVEHEVLHRRASGELCPVGIHLDVIHRDDQPLLLATVLDLTARKATEAALRDSEERHRSALAALADGVAVYDRAGRLITSNPAAERILGVSRDEYSERGVNDGHWWIIHADGTPFRSDAWPSVATLRTGIAQRDVEMGIVQPDETVTWLLVSSEPIRDTVSGEVQAVAVSFADITARKASEAELQRSEARFRTLFTAARVVMLLIDPGTGAIIDANAAAGDYYGYALERLRAMAVSDLNALPPEQIAEKPHQTEQTGSGHFLVPHRLASGEVRDVEVYAGPLELDSRTCLLAVVHDVSDRHRAEEALRVNLETLRRHDTRMIQLNRLNERLLSCETHAEAYCIIAQSAGPLFAGQSGALAIIDAADAARLRVVATWGDLQDFPDSFPLNDCWAMRRGSLHEVSGPATVNQCRHFLHAPPSAYLGVPLIVRGETLGLLHVSLPDAIDEEQHRELQNITQAVSESVKLALSNLRLQEALREAAIRDRLTGLFNRRYLDETLPRELHRCQRQGKPLTTAMLDVDHFKRFNDHYGHDAGDAVLRAVGDLLNRSLRVGDLACRYGGEELTLILPDATADAAWARLDRMRQDIMALRVLYQGGELPAITVSIGIAAAQVGDLDAAALLARADAALYRAKASGRNRVTVADVGYAARP